MKPVTVQNKGPNKWIASCYYHGFKNFSIVCSFEQLDSKLASFGWIAA